MINDNTHSVTVGYILWIFGFMGAHRFYFGKRISGTIYFFTLGLLGIGWLVDLLLIPQMDQEADERYRGGEYDYNISWLLLGFLGLFGAHRFYMGKILSGVLYLFTGAFFGIGWLCDLWTLNEQVDELNRMERH